MDEILDQLCIKYGMSKTAMRAVCESPIKFISEKIRSKDFKNFSIPFLGKIYLKAFFNSSSNLDASVHELDQQKIRRKINRENAKNHTNEIQS